MLNHWVQTIFLCRPLFVSTPQISHERFLRRFWHPTMLDNGALLTIGHWTYFVCCSCFLYFISQFTKLFGRNLDKPYLGSYYCLLMRHNIVKMPYAILCLLDGIFHLKHFMKSYFRIQNRTENIENLRCTKTSFKNKMICIR